MHPAFAQHPECRNPRKKEPLVYGVRRRITRCRVAGARAAGFRSTGAKGLVPGPGRPVSTAGSGFRFQVPGAWCRAPVSLEAGRPGAGPSTEDHASGSPMHGTVSAVSPRPLDPDQLDALNRLTTVGRLLSTAVHETGNSLQVIQGNAEMLSAKPDDPEKTRARAATIRGHAEQAARRLQDLAALARPDIPPPVRLTLSDVVGRAVDLRKYSLSRRRVSLQITDADAGLAVRVPEPLAIRLVVNLLLNAEDGLPAGAPGTITLTLGRHGPMATVAVEDSGPAPGAEQLAVAFEPGGSPRDAWGSLAAARTLAVTLGGTLEAACGATGMVTRLSLPVA